MESGVQSRRSLVAALGATAAVAALLGGYPALAAPPDEGGFAAAGQEAWKSVELIGADGRAITLGEIAAPVVVTHVWASWCAACLGELPALEGWAARLDPASVAPILVSHPKHWDADQAFLRRAGVSLPAYTVAPDTPWEMRAAVFNVVGGSFTLPRTLVFAGRDRRCVLAKDGREDWQSSQFAARVRTWLRSAAT